MLRPCSSEFGIYQFLGSPFPFWLPRSHTTIIRVQRQLIIVDKQSKNLTHSCMRNNLTLAHVTSQINILNKTQKQLKASLFNQKQKTWRALCLVSGACQLPWKYLGVASGYIDDHFIFLVKIEKNFEKIKNCRGYTIALKVVDKLL